jgi:hypothetical protein
MIYYRFLRTFIGSAYIGTTSFKVAYLGYHLETQPTIPTVLSADCHYCMATEFSVKISSLTILDPMFSIELKTKDHVCTVQYTTFRQLEKNVGILQLLILLT